MTEPSVSPDGALLGAALAGDEGAFRRLTEPYRRELHVHCYRMLGSFHDAEDLLQETLLRAWNRLGSYEGRAPIRAWLYKIATNACLNELKRRERQLPPTGYGPPTGPGGEHIPFAAEVTQLEPYPDLLLDELRSDAADPAARYLSRETIGLAFLAAIQLLPARQRAVLILCEVLDFSASETAELLETTVPAVNSALQRARKTLAAPPAAAPSDVPADAGLLDRYLRAFEDGDMTALTALLREDVILTMPPAPSWYAGRDSVMTWFTTSEFAFGDATRRFRLVPIGANGQPGFAAYVPSEDGEAFVPYGLMVLRVSGGRIAEITGFGIASLFARFGLPETLD